MRAWRWLVSVVVAATVVGVAPAQAATHTIHVTHVTAAASPSTVYVGARTVVAGVVAPKTAGSVVDLQRLVSGHWRTLTHVRTGKGGRYAFAVHASKKPATWALRVAGAGAVSKSLHLRITKSRFTIRSLTQASVQATTAAGAPVVVTGSVTPKAAGHVALQAFSAGAWHTVATALLSKTSTYALGVNKSPGVYRLRVVRAFTKTVAAGTSKTMLVTVAAPPTPPLGPTPPVAAPTVSISLAGTTIATGVYSGAVTATVTAAAAAGVRSTTYSLDGAAPVAYTGPITVTAAASHTLVATTTDTAGTVANATAFWTQQAAAPGPGTGIFDNFAAGGTVSPTCAVTGFDGVLPNNDPVNHPPCLAGNMAFTPGVGLAITSTSGQLASGTQQNALYKVFDGSTGTFTVTARVVGGLGQISQNYQQIGAFFGPDTNHFVKVEAEHNTDAAPHLTFYYRDNDVPFNNTLTTVVPAGLATATTLDLIIKGNAKALTVAYSINGAAPVTVGSSKTPKVATTWFSSFSYAGIVVANPGGASPITGTYSSFSITHG
jgi:hypothetical protein